MSIDSAAKPFARLPVIRFFDTMLRYVVVICLFFVSPSRFFTSGGARTPKYSCRVGKKKERRVVCFTTFLLLPPLPPFPPFLLHTTGGVLNKRTHALCNALPEFDGCDEGGGIV